MINFPTSFFINTAVIAPTFRIEGELAWSKGKVWILFGAAVGIAVLKVGI